MSRPRESAKASAASRASGPHGRPSAENAFRHDSESILSIVTQSAAAKNIFYELASSPKQKQNLHKESVNKRRSNSI